MRWSAAAEAMDFLNLRLRCEAAFGASRAEELAAQAVREALTSTETPWEALSRLYRDEVTR